MFQCTQSPYKYALCQVISVISLLQKGFLCFKLQRILLL